MTKNLNSNTGLVSFMKLIMSINHETYETYDTQETHETYILQGALALSDKKFPEFFHVFQDLVLFSGIDFGSVL